MNPGIPSLWAGALAAVLLMGSAGEALGQQPGKADTVGQLEEVVVTATKRASTVQETPISITALTGEDIQERGLPDFAAIVQSVPGRVHALERARSNRSRDARHDFGGRQFLHSRILPRRHAADGARERAERQGRHRSEPLRSEPGRGVARPAGNPVRVRLHGRHHQTRPQRAESCGVRGVGGADTLVYGWRRIQPCRKRHDQPSLRRGYRGAAPRRLRIPRQRLDQSDRHR